MKCDQCKYHFELHGKRWCDRHNTFIPDDVSCCYVGESRDPDDEDEPKPITNYDRLHRKTLEELAKELVILSDRCPDGVDCESVPYGRECVECWLDWLKQEAT